jgi:predicted AAA+ superfamily ATPase
MFINTICTKNKLIKPIYLFDWSYKKQISNPKKIYSVDVGLSKIVSFEVGQRLGDILEKIIDNHQIDIINILEWLVIKDTQY